MDGFIRENPIKMDHLGVPIYGNLQMLRKYKNEDADGSDGNFQCLICNHVKAKILILALRGPVLLCFGVTRHVWVQIRTPIL